MCARARWGGVRGTGGAGKDGDEQDRLLSVVVKAGGYSLQRPGGDSPIGQMATASDYPGV